MEQNVYKMSTNRRIWLDRQERKRRKADPELMEKYARALAESYREVMEKTVYKKVKAKWPDMGSK